MFGSLWEKMIWGKWLVTYYNYRYLKKKRKSATLISTHLLEGANEMMTSLFFFFFDERYNRIAFSLARFGLSHVTKDVWMEETTSFIVSCRGV